HVDPTVMYLPKLTVQPKSVKITPAISTNVSLSLQWVKGKLLRRVGNGNISDFLSKNRPEHVTLSLSSLTARQPAEIIPTIRIKGYLITNYPSHKRPFL